VSAAVIRALTSLADNTPLVSEDVPLELQADKNRAAADALIATFEKLMTDTEQTLPRDTIVSKTRTKTRLSCYNYGINLVHQPILVKF
jgi:hypothetical protein